MKVAFFIGVVKENIDGVSNSLFRLLDFLSLHRVESIVFSTSIPRNKHGAKFVKVSSVPLPFYKEYRLALLAGIAVDKNIKKFKPDIIHIMSPCPLGLYGALYGKKHRIPVVATYHTHFASYAKYYSVEFLEKIGWSYLKYLYANCQSTYVPSKPVLLELRKHGLKHLFHLPHGVDTSMFNPEHRSLKWRQSVGAEKKVVLLYVGRLVWEKDLRVLAKSYRLLRKKRKDFILVIVGSGPIRDELKKLMPGAKFLGAKFGKDLSVAYASSDIFVFPSTTETFGLVTLEAMASGLAVVVADEGGSRSLVEHEKTGLLTKPRNSLDFARKVNHLIHDLDEREKLSFAALQFAQHQDWEFIFQKQLRYYRQILKKFPRRRKTRRKNRLWRKRR